MKYLGREDEYICVNGRLNFLIEVEQGIATVMGGILAEQSFAWCYGACLVIAVLTVLPVAGMTEPPCAEERGNIQV